MTGILLFAGLLLLLFAGMAYVADWWVEQTRTPIYDQDIDTSFT